MPDCEKCGDYFPNYVWIEGKKRNLKNRKYCLKCSAFGLHNTKKLNGQKIKAAVRVPRVTLGKLPRDPLLPSEDLAYLIGVISGDGSLSRLGSKYKLAIACDNRYPDLIEKYVDLVKRVTGGKVYLCRRKQFSGTEVATYGYDLPTLLGLPSGTKSKNGYTIPEWIFSSDSFIRPFLRGLIETDGGVYRTYHKKGWYWYCQFAAKYDPIMLAFLRGTEMLGYSFKRKADKARLSNTEKVRTLINEPTISKIREYRYD